MKGAKIKTKIKIILSFSFFFRVFRGQSKTAFAATFRKTPTG